MASLYNYMNPAAKKVTQSYFFNPLTTSKKSSGVLGESNTRSLSSNGATSANKVSSGGNSGSKDSRSSNESDEIAKARKKLQEQIKNSFSSTIDNYKNQISGLPEQQQESMGQIENLAGTQRQSVTDALNSSLAKFGGYRDEVSQNQKRTLKDLSDNTRNLFQAGNNYLGARGAGNSSATGMYSAALTQQANKQRADIQNQTSSQYNDLNMAEQDTQSEAQNSLNQIETWKATQQATIVSQYQDLKRQLESAYANAEDSQKAAIANLSTQLLNQAQASLSNINNVASQYQQQLAQGLGSQTQQNYTQGISGLANNAAGNVVQQQYDIPTGIQQGQTQQDGSIIDQSTGKIWKKDPTTGQWYMV